MCMFGPIGGEKCIFQWIKLHISAVKYVYLTLFLEEKKISVDYSVCFAVKCVSLDIIVDKSVFFSV